MPIRDLLTNKTGKERATTKGLEIAKLVKSLPRRNVKFSGADFDIEIIDTSAIEGGIQVFARAWDANGNPVGFGADGTVEIERFRIFNPPINVSDPLGDMEETHRDGITGETVVARYKESPIEALLNDLAHTIKVVGKDGGNIVKGKTGNTTSTFRSVAGANDPVDGRVSREGVNETVATIRTGAGTGVDNTGDIIDFGQIQSSATTNQYKGMRRYVGVFDTSAIDSGDTVSSAVWSFKAHSLTSGNGSPALHIFWGVSAANNAIATGDFANNAASASIGSVSNATMSTNANSTPGSATFNDITLSDLTNINKGTGARTKIGSGTAWDVLNDTTGLSWVGLNTETRLIGFSADTADTANDPKLVVEHAVAVTANPKFLMFM